MKLKLPLLLPAILAVILCFAWPHTSMSQTLEEVNFDSLGTWGVNTYVSDINDSGFICGTYDSAGVTAGFVINNEGVIRRFIAAPGSSYEAMSINNNHTVLLKRTTGSTIAVYKAYYIAYSQSYGTPVAVGNVQQPNSVPLGINKYNDIAGYYPGGSSRWLFVLHDSITPNPCPTWDANRYTVGPTYYNTYGFGINDNNMVCGYYIDAPNEKPVIYDEITGTFTALNTTFTKMHPYDINNNNVMVGEYQQANGFYMAFWAQVNAPNMTFHTMNTLFTATNIQSKASGINNKGEIVGSYLHPATGKWVGFIYRPNTNGYRLPGYDIMQHTYALQNSSNAATNGVWTTNYYSSFNYHFTDPYYWSINSPILDSFNMATQPQLATIPYATLNRICADWAAFATEVDTTSLLNNPDPIKQARYKNVWRHFAFGRWLSSPAYVSVNFPGICYGFAFTSLIRYAKDSVYHDWYGLPYNSTLSSFTQSSSGAIKAVTRTYLKQFDGTLQNFTPSTRKWIKPWNGLYRLKNTYLETDPERRNPRAVYIRLKDPNPNPPPAYKYGYHSILPYKIHTPQIFPFDDGAGNKAYDTMFVYDSNKPLDTSQHFVIDATSIYVPNDSARDTTYADLSELVFNEAGLKQILKDKHSQLKATSMAEDSFFRVGLAYNSYYWASNASGQAIYDASGYNNTTSDYSPIEARGENIDRPVSHIMDSSAGSAINIHNFQYTDSVMMWMQSNQHRIMGITRVALPAQSDNSTVKNRLITYGTHDAAPKSLNCYLEEMSSDYLNGVNILARNLGVVQGDSLLTENPSQYVYKITKLTPGSTTYDLWIYSAGDDSVRQFINNGITLTGNTSHTIVPFYDGPNGTQVVVYVDQGMDNVYEDTLFVTYVPVEINEVPHNADYIKVYPNPAQKLVSVAINRPQQAMYTVSLLDVVGKVVYKQQMAFKAGEDVQQVPVAGLAPGAYFIRIADDKGKNIYMDKIIKQ